MASPSRVTKVRRKLAEKRAGSKARTQRRNKGTTPKLLPLLGKDVVFKG